MELGFTNSRKTGKARKLKLYDTIEKIPVKVFYQILTTSDLSLLRVNPELQEETWGKLCEDYYIAINKASYDTQLAKIKKKELLRNKIATCYAAKVLKEIGCEYDGIDETLKIFGYPPGITASELDRRLQREASYLKLLESQESKATSNEVINFWKMISQYEEAVGRQIDVDKVSLARWIEMLKATKKNG